MQVSKIDQVKSFFWKKTTKKNDELVFLYIGVDRFLKRTLSLGWFLKHTLSFGRFTLEGSNFSPKKKMESNTVSHADSTDPPFRLKLPPLAESFKDGSFPFYT